jgi:serine/threonine protein kinase/Tol biopolymer transport system component
LPLSAGSKLGPYEIVGPLGAGGMGEVYRARDTRLDRDVAIKVLPEHAAQSPDARQRFEREARAISSLNDPHICTLYDVGHQNGTDFLVMELIEGETLAKRLEAGPIGIPDLLRIAIDVAGALEKAHRHGVLHRDLKPQNVMLTKAGAKLMDFGLAKSAGAAVPGSSVPQSLSPPTRTTPLTAQGTLVGTFQYMSPEQVEGNDADVRSDIFAVGAVLYEMATGRRAFEGKTTASVIAAVLERDPPPISSVQPLSPPALERTVRTCLAKDPDARFQSAHDVRLQLEWIRDSSATEPAPTAAPHRSRREIAAWTITALLAAITAGLTYATLTRASKPNHAVIADIGPPPQTAFALWGVAPGMPALSPDGTTLAFVAQTADGRQPLWLQPLDSSAARPVDGTDDAQRPFWSSDGRSVGYFHRGELYRVDVSGAPPIAVATVGSASSATWSNAGVILVASQVGGGRTTISRVAASGGAPEVIEKPTAAWKSVAFPQFLPDGRHFLFYARSSSADATGTYAASLDGGDPQRVLNAASPALYAAPGYLMFVRDRTLMAQPFDARTLRISGDAQPVVGNVDMNEVNGHPVVTASATGVLVLERTSAPADRIVWYDPAGNSISTTGAPGEWGTPSLSPDGRRLAISYSDPRTGNKPDVWVYDLARNVKTRVTSAPGINADAFWSPDNQHVCFVSNRDGAFRLYEQAADGTGTATPIVGSEEANAAEFFGSWSADGRYLAFQRTAGTRIQTNYGPGNGEIWAVALSGDRKPFPVVQNGQFVAIQPALSPDAKWLAYVSDESGRSEVYVVPFPHGSGRVLVSSGGGIWPRWSRDAKELWYRHGDRMMAVDITAKDGILTVGRTQQLFEAESAPGGLGPMYDVSADGKKFVIASRDRSEAANPLTLVLNWPALLKRR